MDNAARAAHAAFLKWREVPVVERVQVFYRYKDLLEKHAGEIARILSAENGKTVDDAAGSVRRAGHRAVQLSGDGTDVDVSLRHRLRQHVHPEAVGEGAADPHAHRRIVARCRPSRGRVQPAARVARSSGRLAGAPAGACDFVCRVESGGEVRVPDG